MYDQFLLCLLVQRKSMQCPLCSRLYHYGFFYGWIDLKAGLF